MLQKFEIDNPDLIDVATLIYQLQYHDYYIKETDKEYNYARFIVKPTPTTATKHSASLQCVDGMATYDYVLKHVHK